MNKAKGWVLWGPVVAYTGLIFWISSAPRPIPGIEFFPQMDKVCHAVEYLGLGILWLRALTGSWHHRAVWQLCVIALLACLVTGGLDELYQDPIPIKEADFWDFFSDGIGSLLGIGAYAASNRRRKKIA